MAIPILKNLYTRIYTEKGKSSLETNLFYTAVYFCDNWLASFARCWQHFATLNLLYPRYKISCTQNKELRRDQPSRRYHQLDDFAPI
jgi:hypothetical protein